MITKKEESYKQQLSLVGLIYYVKVYNEYKKRHYFVRREEKNTHESKINKILRS